MSEQEYQRLVQRMLENTSIPVISSDKELQARSFMTNEEILREIAALSPEGRNLLEDFLSFIRQRYARQDAPTPSTPLPSENFIGMWRDRDEMTDSTTWLRNLRASEWGQ